MTHRGARNDAEPTGSPTGVEEDRGLAAPPGLVEECEVCGSQMYGLHCKLVCPNCGYRRDCSDP